jgi:hypothetical protein
MTIDPIFTLEPSVSRLIPLFQKSRKPPRRIIAKRWNCPPDIEEIAEACCMETLDLPERLAFEDHCITCVLCASIVAGTEEFVRSMRNALGRLGSEGRDSPVTHRTGTANDGRHIGFGYTMPSQSL